MIQPLTREESERTADVAAKVEEIVAAVNRQDAQLDFLLREVKRVENLVTGEGGQAADGESAMERLERARLADFQQVRAERDAAQARVAALEAAHGEQPYRHYGVTDHPYVRDLRAERDAALARVVELEADNASMREDAVLAMLIRRMPKDSSLKRTSFQTWLYRSGPLKWGAGGTPKEALEAALGEKGTDGR